MTQPYIDKHTDLVERCKKGESKAQFELYKHYSKAMFNVCMRMMNHVGEAEDVLQESFIDAFSKINDFRQQSSFGSWLKQIVINKALNHLRSRKVTFLTLDTVDTEGDISSIADVSEAYDEEKIQFEVEKIVRAMTQLPDGYRTVLSLYLFEGFDHEEIGNILGINESTSRTQYIRAKKRLLAILTQTQEK